MTEKTKTAEETALNETVSTRVTQGEIDKAKKEGALEAAKEQAKESAKFFLDGNMPGEVEGPKYANYDEIMLWADLLDLGIEALKDRIKEGSDYPVPEEKIYGLLALERNGQNRTDYVKAMMDRLGLKADELPGGGPDYTNDTTPITKL